MKKKKLSGFLNDVIEDGIADESLRIQCLEVIDEMLRLGLVNALDVWDLVERPGGVSIHARRRTN